MPEDRPRRPPGPGDYLFFVVPEPILRTQRITRADKLIWAVIYAWQRMGRRRLTVAKLAELVGQDRRYVRKRLDHLEQEGLIGRRRKRRRGLHLVDLWVDWPDWIAVEGAGMLIRPVALGEDEEDLDALESDAGATDDADEAENSTHMLHPRGGTEYPPRGGTEYPPRGGTEYPPSKEILKEDQERPLVASTSSGGCDHPAPGDPGGDPELEDDPDGGSRTVTSRLERTRQEKRAAREAAGQKGARREPSGPELAETPSARWEWTAWEKKARNRWVARDLVGYWVTRHRTVRGEEDPEFFVTSVAAPAVVRLTKNVRRYVETWLNGDFYGEGRDAVDLILERAVSRGLPVSLAYYFTPSKRGALPGLGKTARGKAAAPTPTERSDVSGGDKDFWRKRAQAQEEG